MTKQEFNQELKSSSDVAVQRANKFLEQLHLSLHINWEYEDWEYNGLDNAIGVYEGGSVFDERGMSIGFNVNNLYKWFVKETKNYPWSDPYTILNEAIQTNVFHEMGHGIVELFSDYLQQTDDLDELYDNNQELFDNILDNEEDSVEEFAWAMYDNQLNNSRLYKVIYLYLHFWDNTNKSLTNEDNNLFSLNETKKKNKKKKELSHTNTFTPPTFNIWTKEQLFAMDYVASVYTNDIAGLSIPQLKDYIQNMCKSVELNTQFVYSRHHIGNLVSHRAVNKEMKKVAMSSIPYVLNNGHPVTNWQYKPNPQNPIDRMPSCLYGAPIMIDDVKYLCLLTIKFNNLTGKIFPYVINIEDENGMKVSGDISVLDNNGTTTPSNSGTSMGTVTSQDNRTPSNPTAKVQHNVEPTKDNSEITTENKQHKTNKHMKQTIKLTESDLRRMISESVKRVLNEGLWNAIEMDNYQVYDNFVDFIKNYYAPNDDNKAYEIEDSVNDWIVQMMEDLDSKYGK